MQMSSPHVSQYSNKHADETFTSQLPWEGENDGCSVCDQKLYRWGGGTGGSPLPPPQTTTTTTKTTSASPQEVWRS